MVWQMLVLVLGWPVHVGVRPVDLLPWGHPLPFLNGQSAKPLKIIVVFCELARKSRIRTLDEAVYSNSISVPGA